jgi:hypothetical protein
MDSINVTNEEMMGMLSGNSLVYDQLIFLCTALHRRVIQTTTAAFPKFKPALAAAPRYCYLVRFIEI